MIQQRYGNNIPLRITLSLPGGITDRHVEVSVLRRMGRTIPFAFTTDGNTLSGTIFGKDQPNREDMLSLRITLDRGTETQQIIDVPNVVALTSKTTYATMTATQVLLVQTDGNHSFVQIATQVIPRKKATVPAASASGSLPTHETMAPTATPDITLT